MKSNFRRNVERAIFGYPDQNIQVQVEEHAAFIKEFLSFPEAERLRIKYRVAVFCLICGGTLLLSAPPTTHYFPEAIGNLAPGIGGGLIWFLIGCDRFYVRRVMKRRARLGARGYPRFTEKLLWFFLPSETCDEAIDDLNAKFEVRKAKFSTSWARWWYCWQTARSLSPRFDRLIECLIKWGVLGWIGKHF